MTWMCERWRADRCCAMRCGAPLWPWRTTNMSAFIATRLSMVSSRVSPLLVDETPTLILMTSADRRLAAISNVVRVRVLFSKKRLNTVLPRNSGTFLTSRSAIETNGTAVSRMRSMIAAGMPSSVSRCCSAPSALSCGLGLVLSTRFAGHGLDRKLESIAVTVENDRKLARHRDARAYVRGFDRQLAASAIDQHRELDFFRPSVVEQLVDRRANRAAGVEDIVDEHDVASLHLERQCRRRDLGAQTFLSVIVAVERHVDEAYRVLSRQEGGEPLGEPRAAGIDADQLGVHRHRATHLVKQRGKRLFSLRQTLRQPLSCLSRRRVGQNSSAG